MQTSDDFRPSPAAGTEIQKRWFATVALFGALIVLAILAPKLAGS